MLHPAVSKPIGGKAKTTETKRRLDELRHKRERKKGEHRITEGAMFNE
jgi:hypothetical protein